MHTRLGSILIVASLAVALTGCSDGGGKITIGASSKSPTTAVAADETTVDSGDSGDAPSGTIPGSSGETVPEDLGTLPSGIDKCVALGQALSSLAASATGQSIPDSSKQEIEDAKSSLPENIQADVDIVVNAYEKLGTSGGDISKAAEAVSSPEFTKATDELQTYISGNCGG